MSKSNLPAFPVVAFNEEGELTNPESYNGLTKREYFAVKAMQGLLANKNYKETFYNKGEMAEKAVNYADSLLAELDKED